MIGRLDAVEYSRELGIPPLPLDTVEVENGSMRRETRPDRRAAVVFRPIDELRQRGPIRFIDQPGCAGRRARYDQPVELARPEFVDVLVIPAEMRSDGVRTRKLGQ